MSYKNYQEQLATEGLAYLAGLSTMDLVALDIETTGLQPASAQITQIAATTVEDHSGFYSRKAGLTEETIGKLQTEYAKHQQYVGFGSTHWVLTYNGYHEAFKWLCPQDAALPGVKRPLAITGAEGGIAYVQSNTPAKLSISGLQEITKFSSQLASEADVLEGIRVWLDAEHSKCPGLMLLGQNIIAFDLPFIGKRSSLCGITALPVLPVVDTMWISRIIFIPLLRALAADKDELSTQMLLKLSDGKGGFKSGLQDLRKALGVKGGTAHDALGDCTTTFDVLLAMKAYAKDASLRMSAYAEQAFKLLSGEASVKPDRR